MRYSHEEIIDCEEFHCGRCSFLYEEGSAGSLIRCGRFNDEYKFRCVLDRERGKPKRLPICLRYFAGKGD